MILRPRQTEFANRCRAALEEHGNTLGVAPTGSGKTVILSAVATGRGATLILQHRDELVDQNRRTFKAVNPGTQTDLFTADRKRFVRDGATFGMVQTLVRNLDRIPALDLLIIDEAHHVAADSYLDIIDTAKAMNPAVHIFGVTATPTRGDRKALKKIFSNVADVMQLGDLVAEGHLVPPRGFVIDLGMREELSHVRKTLADFDMAAVETIMDKSAVNAKVVEEWRKAAGDRQTVVFCSTIAHAEHIMAAFVEAGVLCSLVTGATATAERSEMLAAFDARETQVLFNVAVLVEGWDCQPVSCVVLLRPCSQKSSMLQMIGRGLRKLDPVRYPGQIKDDCVILDFGHSLLTHGNLDVSIDLEPLTGKGAAPMKDCPVCQTSIPCQCMLCPICGYVFESNKEEKEALETFILTEVDLLNRSPFRWENFWDGLVTIADGMEAWAAIVFLKGRYYSIGAQAREACHLLGNNSTKIEALATADDYLRQHGDARNAKKSREWLSSPATVKQLQYLGMSPTSMHSLTRYRASCHLTWKFNERSIRQTITR